MKVVGSSRKVMKPFKFSNGVIVPRGVTLAAPIGPIQRDPTIYENASKFDGFRFSRMREQFGEKAEYYATNTTTELLHFGHGQHAW